MFRTDTWGTGPQGRRESGMLEDTLERRREEKTKEGGRWVCGRELGSRQSELQQGLAGVQGCCEIQEARGEDVGTTTTRHASYCVAC